MYYEWSYILLYYTITRAPIARDAILYSIYLAGSLLRIIMSTENLAENPATDYSTFEPPACNRPDKNKPRSDQYQPLPSCKKSDYYIV